MTSANGQVSHPAQLPRLGKGVCWSQVRAEIDEDLNRPHPKPEPVATVTETHSTPAGDPIAVEPDDDGELRVSPWFMSWVC